MEEESLEKLAKEHELTIKEIKRLRKEASTPWAGATSAHLKFEQLIKEAKEKMSGGK